MPFKLTPPVEQTLYLEKTDAAFPPEETNEGVVQKTYVIVKQASQSAHERRSDLFSKMTSRVGDDPNVVEIVSRFSYPELQRIETFLALKDCNIEDENGNKLFKFNNGVISQRDFNDAWGKLPPLVAGEIHEKVLEVNPTWGKMGEAS